MTRRVIHKGGGANSLLDEALAALITCTRSKRRPLSLPKATEWLEVAVSELGSYEAVAERIGITSKMLRQFSYVNRLSKPVKEMFEKRALDSVDAATHLAMLPPKDQLVVARALAEGIIDTSDVRAVVQWRGARPRVPIDRLVKGVRESKTLQRYVAEFVVRGAMGRQTLLRAFRKHIRPEDVIDVEINGSLGRLLLTRNGKQQLFQTAKRLGVKAKNVIPEILWGTDTE